MPERRNRWTVARARQHLPQLLSLAAREPQPVYRRDKLVATVVSPEVGQQLLDEQAGRAGSLADNLAELRTLCSEESYQLEVPPRVNRPLRPKRRARR